MSELIIYLAYLRPVDWTQIIVSIGTMTTAIVAVIAAIQSFRSAKQNNETNEQIIRPRVVVYVGSSNHDIAYIDLVVFNEGGGLARDIKFHISGDDPQMYLSDSTIRPMSELDVIKNGIKVLPSKNLRSYFVLSISNKKELEYVLSLNTHIKVSYANLSGLKKFEDIFDLDFVSLPKMRFADKNLSSQKKIADETEKIRKLLEKKNEDY